MTPPTGRLWTSADLADYMQVTESTIRDWRSRDYGPKATKIGRVFRYNPIDVQKWWERQQRLSS